VSLSNIRMQVCILPPIASDGKSIRLLSSVLVYTGLDLDNSHTSSLTSTCIVLCPLEFGCTYVYFPHIVSDGKSNTSALSVLVYTGLDLNNSHTSSLTSICIVLCPLEFWQNLITRYNFTCI